MEKLTFAWKIKDWSAKTFLIGFNQQIVGTLTFNDLLTYNAAYETGTAIVHFIEKGYFNEQVDIKKQNRLIGQINFKTFGTRTLKLASGEIFTLSANLFGGNLKWLNEKGEILVEIKQPTLKTLGQGQINTDLKLDKELSDLLVSSGLYVSNLTGKKMARFMPLLIIIMGGLKIFG